MAMWLFDLVVAGTFVFIYEKTGQDVTMGEAYRNSTDVIFKKSRIAGMLSVASNLIYAVFWSGPEHVVVFLKKSLRP